MESNLKVKLAPLLKLVHLIPTDVPPVKTGVQRGEKDVGSSKDSDQGKVVGKVMSTQIPTSLHTLMSTTSTTMTLNPLNKGIVIGSSTGGSSSNPPPSSQYKGDRRKGIMKELTEEEKKENLEKEIEKQRQINSISRQRQGDPPGLDKGDLTNQYYYETIEKIVSLRNMYDFEKVPKKSFDIINTNFNQQDIPINQMIFISS